METGKQQAAAFRQNRAIFGGVSFTIALKYAKTRIVWAIGLYLFAADNRPVHRLRAAVARRLAPGHDLSHVRRGLSVDDELISAIKKYATLVLVAAVLVALVHDYKSVPEAYPQEIFNGPKISGANPEIPLQDDLSARHSFRDGNFTIDVLAGYDIYGIVVHRARYYDDPLSSISSLDLGIAFGDFVRHPDLLDRFRFGQVDRFIYIKPKDSVPGSDWIQYTWQVSNNHLIFSSSELAAVVHAASVGDRVRLKGYLIRASTANLTATSSLTRYDTGAGACEIIFVTDARVFSTEDSRWW